MSDSAKVKIPRWSFKNPLLKTFNDWLDTLTGKVESALNVSGSGIVDLTRTPFGVNIHVPAFPIRIAKITSSIGIRSGTTPGTGTATLQLFNGSALMDDAARPNQTVYNFSATAGGVASGKYCILLKVGVYWFIVAVEC